MYHSVQLGINWIEEEFLKIAVEMVLLKFRNLIGQFNSIFGGQPVVD